MAKLSDQSIRCPVVIGRDDESALLARACDQVADGQGQELLIAGEPWDALHPYSAGGGYVNFMMEEGSDRIRATYRDNYDRLALVKATYDPDNLFSSQPEHPAEDLSADRQLPRRSAMNGIHDMGGMHGFGPVVHDEHEPHSEAAWVQHVGAINRLSMGAGLYNIDEFRYGIERMNPADYLRSGYFERWLATIEHNLIAKGYISADELESRLELLRRDPDAELPPAQHPSPPPVRARNSPAEVPVTPRFAVGDEVVAHNVHPTTHTRLPRYARGKRGVIHQVRGPRTFPDSHAHGRGEDPRVLYNVRFTGQELWGDSAEPHQELYLDLWEPYLLPLALSSRAE